MKIGEHDLMIKVNHAREFLKEGNKVQFTLQFRGREMAHLELGRDIFKKIKDELWLVSKVERDAKMEGRRMTLVLQPDHKSPDAVKPVQGGTAPVQRAGSGLNIPPRPAAGPATGPARPGVAAGPGAAPVRPAAATPAAPAARPATTAPAAPAARPAPAPAGAR